MRNGHRRSPMPVPVSAGQFRAPAAKVLHWFGSPVSNPFFSHWCRIAEEPCVHWLGSTRPADIRWM